MFDQIQPSWATQTLRDFASRITEQVETADDDSSRAKVRKDVETFFAALHVEAKDELEHRLSAVSETNE